MMDLTDLPPFGITPHTAPCRLPAGFCVSPLVYRGDLGATEACSWQPGFSRLRLQSPVSRFMVLFQRSRSTNGSTFEIRSVCTGRQFGVSNDE